MSDLYNEIRKNKYILEKRIPWEEETERRLFEWETSQFIYSCMWLAERTLTRKDVVSMLSGDVVQTASFADYAKVQGLESALRYIRRLAGGADTPFQKILLSETPFDKLPNEAELCLLWCFLEGKSEAEAHVIWKEKAHYRRMSPVVRDLLYMPCHFSELPEKMTELYAWLKTACSGRMDGEGRAFGALQTKAADEYGVLALVNPVRLAAEFHNRLIALWPFESHNEDIAKLASEAVLLAFGFPLVPWAIQKEEYKNILESYLKALEAGETDDGFCKGSEALTVRLMKLIRECQTVQLAATERT